MILTRLATAWALFQGLLIEALPFLLIGVLISAGARWFAPGGRWLRRLPSHPLLGPLTGAALGFALPACESGNVPVARRLLSGGAPLGAGLGFLWYNAFPAKVFMGDSGSLPLGGLLAWMAFVSKQELVLPLRGLVFFPEMGSSALQTFWYRRSGGKRIFTMAPIHHGLQTTGGIFRPGKAPWRETKIVTRAYIVAAVCAMASLALLKVR